MNRYSSSPELDLRVGNSRLRLLSYVALCLACGLALWLLCERGYRVPALLLAPVTALFLVRLWRDRSRGVRLCWRQNQWLVERDGCRRTVTLNRCSLALPGIVYLRFQSVGRSRAVQLWLFADSLSREDLRRLRVRVTLAR